MPRLCTICIHPGRREIEKALVSGQPLRKIGTRFGTSITALFRHRDGHLLIEAVKREQEARSVARVDDVLGQARTLKQRADDIFGEAQTIYQEARHGGDPKTALAAIRESSVATREARGSVELVARLTGQLDPIAGVHVDNLMIVLPRASDPMCSPGHEPNRPALVVECSPAKVHDRTAEKS